MGVKLCLILLLLAAAAVPHLAGFIDEGLGRFPNDDTVLSSDKLYEFGQMNPRNLYQKGKFLSYKALMKNIVPCGTRIARRGLSYYNCNARKRANPYRRACLYITGCARITD